MRLGRSITRTVCPNSADPALKRPLQSRTQQQPASKLVIALIYAAPRHIQYCLYRHAAPAHAHCRSTLRPYLTCHCTLCRSPQVNNYYSSGPSFGFSPFGFSPFGFSPFGYGGGAVAVGAPIGGGFLFNFFLVTLALGVVSRVASSFGGNKKDKERDDQW